MNAMTASLSNPPPAQIAPPHATRTVAGVRVSDSPVISLAIEYAREHSEPYLFNHVMRSWLFAESLAQLEGAEYDGEVVALSTLLHDLGLSPQFDGPLRFEVETANAARNFAQRAGLDARRAQLVWDGAALNSTPSIALYKETEVRLCTLGIGLDWGGWGYASLTRAQIGTIVEAFPRLQMKQRFSRAVCRLCEARSATTYDNFARDFGERFVSGYRAPSTVDLLFAAPFEE
jgi:hypothetical protein